MDTRSLARASVRLIAAVPGSEPPTRCGYILITLAGRGSAELALVRAGTRFTGMCSLYTISSWNSTSPYGLMYNS